MSSEKTAISSNENAAKNIDVMSLAKKGDTVILGGVYVDSTVRSWINRVGPEGKLIIIEANPKSVENLKEKFKDQRTLTLISKAIWDSKTKLKFTVSDTDYQGWARVNEDSIGEYPTFLDDSARDIQVEADTLDSILQELNVDNVDLIYLTINDAQIKAVDGFENIRKKSKNFQVFINSRTR